MSRPRAGHTSVSFTLDRYGHLLPGSEQWLNDTLDALAEGAHQATEVTRDADDTTGVREDTSEDTISFVRVARTPEDRDESSRDVQASDQDENSGRCGTRTHDLSRVNPFLCRERHDSRRPLNA